MRSAAEYNVAFAFDTQARMASTRSRVPDSPLFDAFPARPDPVWVEPSRDVEELATAIRVRHGLRTPDALQAASCLQLGPEHVLLTGDASFQRVQGLSVSILG